MDLTIECRLVANYLIEKMGIMRYNNKGKYFLDNI